MTIDLRSDHECRIALERKLKEYGRDDIHPYLLIQISDFLLEWEDKILNNTSVFPTFDENNQRKLLITFAEWLEYNGKYMLPEERVDEFFKQK